MTPNERKKRLVELLKETDHEIKIVAQEFRLNYNDAAQLLAVYHMNALHLLGNFWIAKRVKPK